jgi:hypothetical protein
MMEIIDHSDDIVFIKCTLEFIHHLRSKDFPRIVAFLKCYQRLTCTRTYAEVEKVKAEFDSDVCKAVWGFVGEQEQNRIKEMKGDA